MSLPTVKPRGHRERPDSDVMSALCADW